MLKKLQQWKKDEKYFVKTKASYYVMNCIRKNKCVSVVGPSGVGKTFLVQHVALEIEKTGYTIISVNSPCQIKENYMLNRKTLFIVDDMCGNFTANAERLEEWKRAGKDLAEMLDKDSCKLLLTCRLQVFRDEGFMHSGLKLYRDCVCNLIDDKLALSNSEKRHLATKYFRKSDRYISMPLCKYSFFPLLCKLYAKRKNKTTFDPYRFAIDPFNIYRTELDDLFVDCQEGKYKISALLLLVVHNNHLEKQKLEGKDERVNKILEDIFKECDMSERLIGKKLISVLDTLTGTFVSYEKNYYHTIHDKLFDFLAFYFGTKNGVTNRDFNSLLITHADKNFVKERFVIKESGHSDDTNSDHYLIIIQDNNIALYIERIFSDLTQSDYVNMNHGHHISTRLSTYIKQFHKDKISSLIQNASSDFVCSMFVMNSSDITSYTKYENEHEIILNDDHLEKYIERMFDDMTKSDDVIKYMERSRCCRNETFRIEFLHYIKTLGSTKISIVIQTASSSFVCNMFVMNEEDIHHNSRIINKRYGIELDKDLIPLYSERIVKEMTNCFNVNRFINCLRCSTHKGFSTTFQLYLSQIPSNTINTLIESSSPSFVKTMFVISDGIINQTSCYVHRRFGIKIPDDSIHVYIERVFADLAHHSCYIADEIIRFNRNVTTESFKNRLTAYIRQLDRSKNEDLIKMSSDPFFNQIMVLPIDNHDENCDWGYEIYHVIIPKECIPLYVARWFDGLKKHEKPEDYVKRNRNIHTKVFKKSLEAFILQLQEDEIGKLIETASTSFLNNWFVTKREDIKHDSQKVYEQYGIILQGKNLQMYNERIFTLMTMNINFCKTITVHRNSKCILKYLHEFPISTVKDLIDGASNHVFHQLITVDIEHLSRIEESFSDRKLCDCGVQNTYEKEKGLIRCPKSLINQYMDRMITDWGKGEIRAVINNHNLKNQPFLTYFLCHLNLLDTTNIYQLLQRKDYKRYREETAFTLCCKSGKVNFAKWCLDSYLNSNPQTDKIKLCGLFLLVAFNNKLDKKILHENNTKVDEVISSFNEMHDICEGVSAKEVKDELDVSMNWIIDNRYGHYSISDNQVFDFLFFYFASICHMSKILVNYVDDDVLCDRFEVAIHKSNFIYELPEQQLHSYIEKIFKRLIISKKIFRELLQWEIKLKIKPFIDYIRKLKQKEINKIIENSSISVINKICVLKEKGKDRIEEDSRLCIVIPDDSVHMYIKRVFQDMTNSDCVENCLLNNENMKHEIFHYELLVYMKDLHQHDIKALINQASCDFINRIFVISVEDIKDESYWEYERYGVAVPEEFIQMYIIRVFSDMIKSVYVPVNRNCMNKTFRDTLHLYINSHYEDILETSIMTATSKCISRMFLSTEEHITDTISPRLECSVMFVPRSYYYILDEKVFEQTNCDKLNKYSFLQRSDSNKFKITTNDNNTDHVLIAINVSSQQHLIQYIDSLFICKQIDCYLTSTNNLESKYIHRILDDWIKGHVHDVFGNINFSNQSFQREFISHLRNTDNTRQTMLANTNDTNTGHSPLVVCCYVGNSQLTEWCLDNCSYNDIDRDNKKGPLYIACINNHHDIVLQLLNHKNKVFNKYSQHETLYEACASGHTTIVSHLLKEKIDVNTTCGYNQNTPLYVACKGGHTEIVSILLRQRAEEIYINAPMSTFTSRGASPLYIACKHGNSEIVSLLLEHTADKVDVNKRTYNNETPLYAACERGYKDIVNFLLSTDSVLINTRKHDGSTPLLVACREGHFEIVSILLCRKGIEIDKCTLTGMSPLFVASLSGNTKIVDLLLRRNADANMCVHTTENEKLFEDDSFLFDTDYSFENTIKYLRNLVRDNASDHAKVYLEGMKEDWFLNLFSRSSPLHMGSVMGHIEIVKLLVDKCSHMNCLNENGSTPLFLACELGHANIARILLANGAETTLVGTCNKLPLTIARENGHLEIVEMIKSQIVE